MRQDHHAADDQPAGGTDGRSDRGWRGRHRRQAGRRTPTGYRLRDPRRRAVSPPVDRRQHCDGATPAGVGRHNHRQPGERTGRTVGARPGVVGPIPGRVVRRSAAAGGCGTSAGRRSAHLVDGRALLGGRPHCARPASGRAAGDPRQAGHHDCDRHPRRGRGTQAGRHHRVDVRRRARRPGRTTIGTAEESRQRIRHQLSWRRAGTARLGPGAGARADAGSLERIEGTPTGRVGFGTRGTGPAVGIGRCHRGGHHRRTTPRRAGFRPTGHRRRRQQPSRGR